ncbi:hypothetical protein [Miltoncostaea marina]|uniref:hypothetical protein n=1 Tax=Miltoncostaea marina TaxID=2843215 RepID=UPI001C3DA14F|nr:hypothetical protein [Miltoncostaea marina]
MSLRIANITRRRIAVPGVGVLGPGAEAEAAPSPAIDALHAAGALHLIEPPAAPDPAADDDHEEHT